MPGGDWADWGPEEPLESRESLAWRTLQVHEKVV